KIIPPGTGICSQFYTDMNCNDLLLKHWKVEEKVKLPLFKDILSRLLELFPDQKYYGYFNSDIILPPGKSIYSLLPSKNKSIIMHHRLDFIGKEDMKIRELMPRSITVVGKDGFIFTKKVAEDIIKNFGDKKHDFFIGRPFWDTALAIYLWSKYGWNRIDFAYKEIWHMAHKSAQQASVHDYNSPGGKWNQTIGDKIFKKDRQGDVWKEVCNEALTSRDKIKRKKIGIIQSGRVGDILIVLPIAKWYYDQGFEVIWPILRKYLEIFDRVNYVHTVPLDSSENSYLKSIATVKEKGVTAIIDLAIGFGREEESWKKSHLSFDEWKYKEAGVPFSEKYNLQFQRDLTKENRLVKKLKLNEYLDGYAVTHSVGSFAEHDFNILDAIEVRGIAGFHFPFDWVTVLENARYYIGIDSCITNLVDQLDLCRGGRYFRDWTGVRHGNDLARRTPNLSVWEKHCPVVYQGKEYPEYINDNNAMSHIINKASKFCKGKGVDLGGGSNPFPGAENIDLVTGADINKILNKGLGHKNLDYIFSSHFLEHVLDYDAVLEECYESLKPGGILFLYLPHPDNEYWHPSNPAMQGTFGHKYVLVPGTVMSALGNIGFTAIEHSFEPDHYYSYYIVAEKEESFPITKKAKPKKAKAKKAKAKKEVKISFVTIVYNGMPFIEPCIEQMKPYAHEIIVVEGKVEVLGTDGAGSTDGTQELLIDLQRKNEIILINGDPSPHNWYDKLEMQNEALKHATGDYVWLVDSDEFYLNKGIKHIIKILEREKPDQINFPIFNFFKGLRHIMTSSGDKFQKLTRAVPRIFANDKGIDFISHWPPETAHFPERLISGLRIKQEGVDIYHMGYMNDAQVKQKCQLYSKTYPDHADIRVWYDNLWTNWTPSKRKQLEGNPHGVWFPDSTSRTKIFKGEIPKILQLIYPNMRGVKWEG
ncbi:MAG: glycosyltransferase, partial [Thermodesulfovibrionia bacterium]|nr:glycosyltransferase [Thermodesulfovibrionia bacterium]